MLFDCKVLFAYVSNLGVFHKYTHHDIFSPKEHVYLFGDVMCDNPRELPQDYLCCHCDDPHRYDE